MSAIAILLVDDDPRDIELTLEALAAQHLAQGIAVAHDGVEALDWLHRRGRHAQRPAGLPLVVLLDIKMPRLDGLEVLRQVKTDPRLRGVPVVVQTSSRDERDLVAGYAHGADAFVTKPLDFAALMSTLGPLGVRWSLVAAPPPRPPG